MPIAVAVSSAYLALTGLPESASDSERRLGVVAVAVIALAALELVLVKRQRKALRLQVSRLGEITSGLAERVEVSPDDSHVIDQHLELVHKACRLGASERVTIYTPMPGSHELFRFGRYSPSKRLRERGRRFIPNRGITQMVLQDHRQKSVRCLPDYHGGPKARRRYVRKQTAKLHVREEVVEGLSLHARAYFAYKLCEPDSGSLVGALIFESSHPFRFVLTRSLKREANRHARYMALYLDKVTPTVTDLPTLELDEEEWSP